MIYYDHVLNHHRVLPSGYDHFNKFASEYYLCKKSLTFLTKLRKKCRVNAVLNSFYNASVITVFH